MIHVTEQSRSWIFFQMHMHIYKHIYIYIERERKGGTGALPYTVLLRMAEPVVHIYTHIHAYFYIPRTAYIWWRHILRFLRHIILLCNADPCVRKGTVILFSWHMTMLWHENAFQVTVPLWEEPICHRWFNLSKAQPCVLPIPHKAIPHNAGQHWICVYPEKCVNSPWQE